MALQAVVFDVFGTVVDWRSTIVREGSLLGARKGLTGIDWGAFADRWRAGYPAAMDEVRRGELGWRNLDALHRRILERILAEFGIAGLTTDEIEELNRVWHRLDPWPDTIEGLSRIKRRYPIATLSNGNVRLLVDMARFSRLPWDAILSAEFSRHYKPDLIVYELAAEWMGCAPRDVLMVAAHPSDLAAAASAGLRTAYVARPLEHGPSDLFIPPTDSIAFDYRAADLIELSRQIV